MEGTTKERILDAALELFSHRGYEGTALRDLAAELGLSKSALYKHYTGKEDIWNSLLESIQKYYTSHIGMAGELPIPDSVEMLREQSLQQISFTMHDEKIIKVRRLLTLEQFRSPEVAELTSRHFLTDIETNNAAVFAGMMEKGIIRKDDPQLLAFAYTAPISVLIHLCDRQPRREPEVTEKIRQFIFRFTEELRENHNGL